MKKIIILNGSAESGKDTICSIAENIFNAKMISSIDPIKSLAKIIGWNGEKDLKSRALLSDLKHICISYNDYPLHYLIEMTERFLGSKNEILFVQIREPSEIDKYKNEILIKYNIQCITMLLIRDISCKKWGNDSDDQVNEYNYDYYFYNNSSIADLEEHFIHFMREKIYV